MNSQIRTRIAPTPSGYLHFGNVLSFITTWLLAKQQQGLVRLRIDDLDAARMRHNFVEDIFETLDWIGLQPDEGPSGVEDFFNHYTQQWRLPAYNKLLELLMQQGLLYACTCSRKEVGQSTKKGIYPGTCRTKPLPANTDGVAWRLALPTDSIIRLQDEYMGSLAIDLDNTMGDFVVRRKEGLPAYQIASLSDDIADNINMIVRGSDLLHSTAAQIMLARLCGADSFASVRFFHHPLVEDALGRKLSKSAKAPSLKQAKEQGLGRAAFLQSIAAQLGFPAFTGETLQALLDFAGSTRPFY